MERALAVDPEGGVELIRWVLRTDEAERRLAGSEALSGTLEFRTRAGFRTWFDEVRTPKAGP